MRHDWVKYKNGNYWIYFNTSDGTKIRRSKDGNLEPTFPENCDMLISTVCDNGCPWCYADCSKNGEFGKLSGWKFLDNINPLTELAINLNFPVHPDLEVFLETMKKKRVFVNLTVNYDHLIKNFDYVKGLNDKKLFYGLGVSFTKNCTEDNIQLIADTFPNVVFHVINGIFSNNDFQMMKYKDLKILVLGYKEFGRGTDWHKNENANTEFNKNAAFLYDSFLEILDGFKVVSFDNLALEQLDVKNRGILTQDEWDMNYMGDDATVTFAINLVKGTFSPNSMSTQEWDIGNKTLEDMLATIREYSKKEQKGE